MSDKILYENYLKDSGEIITETEWMLSEKRYEGKMKKFESYWKGLKRYGIFGLAAYVVGTAVVGTATGGLLSVPLGLILYAGYKSYSDSCKTKCSGNILCFNKCYLAACIPVIQQIDKEISTVKSSKSIDDETKKKTLKKLNKELTKWVKRYTKYKKKIIEIQEREAREERETAINASKERARYYGGNQ